MIAIQFGVLAATATAAFLAGRATAPRRLADEDVEHAAAIKALADRRRNRLSGRGRVVTKTVTTEQMAKPYEDLATRVADDDARGWRGKAAPRTDIGRPPIVTGPETPDVWDPAELTLWPAWGGGVQRLIPSAAAPLPQHRDRGWLPWSAVDWTLGLALVAAIVGARYARTLADRAHRALATHALCWLLASRSLRGICWHDRWEDIRIDLAEAGTGRHSMGDGRREWPAPAGYGGGRHAVSDQPTTTSTGDLTAELAGLAAEEDARQERAFNAAVADLYASVARIGAAR